MKTFVIIKDRKNIAPAKPLRRRAGATPRSVGLILRASRATLKDAAAYRFASTPTSPSTRGGRHRLEDGSMKLPDGRTLPDVEGVLPAPDAAGDRVVLWVRGERRDGFQHWERLSTPPAPTFDVAQGVCSMAVVAVPARQRIGGVLAEVFTRLRRRTEDGDVTLPDGGGVAVWCGPQRADLALAWSEAATTPLDEARVRARWPACLAVRRLGPDLYLVDGVMTISSPAAPAPELEPEPEQPPSESPRQSAEAVLTTARQTGDRPRVVTALIDLGLALLLENEGARADAVLTEARAAARSLNDRPREADALSALAQAALAQGRLEQAQDYLGSVLAHARQTADRYTEKLALERLGDVCRAQGAHGRALVCFDTAAGIARTLGDAPHEADLLWQAAVQHAELRQPRRAVAKAREAVVLLQRLGKPQAEWFALHIARYRAGRRQGAPDAADLRAEDAPPDYRGGTIDAALALPPAPAADDYPTAGPGVLHMALTATRAMALFVGSGFQTADPDVVRARRAACAACVHHTGLRCRACGCMTAAKARLLHEDCPAGKWPR
jgi:tetratricopeptide (TPR) repeat protein